MDMKYEDPAAIRHKLLQEMKNGQYAECDRLPRETVLAEQFGISRTRLRDILAQLEQEGFITRRHGIGTMINHHVLQVKNRMDIEVEFLDIIKRNGYEPAVKNVRIREEKADLSVAEKLRIPEGTAVIRVSRVCTADGVPALYCEDVLEEQRIQGPFGLKDLEPPIFQFLKNVCGVHAYMDLTRLHAVLASREMAGYLNVPEGTPLLNMEETDYDIDGNILFYSSQYFVDEFFDQTVLRKKL